MAEPRTWTLKIDGFEPLSLNDRGHWRRHHQLKAEWRSEVATLAKAERIPLLARIHVALHAYPKTNRRRDADNLVATLKPCIDGLRDAGVIADDTPGHVSFSEPVIHPSLCGGLPAAKRRWTWELVITELPLDVDDDLEAAA
jgi:crossover junction endodeoxyribonuclease RusA